MSDIDDFMKETCPTGKSKLDIYRDEILTLKQHGYSNNDVLLFLLQKKNMKVGAATLTRFLKKTRENNNEVSNIKQPIKPSEPPKTDPVGSVSFQNNSSETKVGKKPFDWEAAKKEDWRDLV